MPTIRSSADLRNKYNEISSFCHQHNEPVFITKNGKGDLAVLSVEAYEQLLGRFELYSRLLEGMDVIKSGSADPITEARPDIRVSEKNETGKSSRKYCINKVGDTFIAFPSDDPWAPARQVLGSFPDDFMKDRNQPSWSDVPAREDL